MSNTKLEHAREIADIMCQRYAKKALKISLPNNYWNLPKWKKRYTQQIIAANGVLNVYPIEAIRAALKRKDGSWQWSVREKSLQTIIQEEHEKILIRKENEKDDRQTIIHTDPTKLKLKKKGGNNKSLRSKLD